MNDRTRDPRAPLDPRIDSPGREGLTGTAPVDRYAPVVDHLRSSQAPDAAEPAAQPAWRQDFPIDWPQDNDVARRDFMKFMVLISSAFAAGQAWIVAQNWWRQRQGHDPIRRLAGVDDLAIGGTLTFAYPGDHDPCVLVRRGATEWVAYSQKCTHLSCAVIPMPAEDTLHCPCHEGRFDLRSGRPTAGPPRRPLPRITLEVRGRDIFATGVEWRTS